MIMPASGTARNSIPPGRTCNHISRAALMSPSGFTGSPYRPRPSCSIPEYLTRHRRPRAHCERTKLGNRMMGDSVNRIMGDSVNSFEAIG